METIYPLNHLIRIAGQYENIGAAKCALAHLKTSSMPESSMPSESPFSSDSGQVQVFETLLDSITVTWNKQRWITIADFFKYVFPRLRPSQQGYLPCIYRTHLHANGELVTKSQFILSRLMTQTCYVTGSRWILHCQGLDGTQLC